MDRYTRVEKPKPESPINENEIRITSSGPIRNYISYACSLLQDKHGKEIVLKAMGQAISKTVTVAEGIRRRIPRLHQDTSISSVSITDVWEPIEEGLEPVELTRQVSMITVTLSFRELNKDSPGYQPPLEQPRQQYQQRQQHRQAQIPYNAVNEDSYGRGRGHGRGRGRGRGRGGYGYGNYQSNYQDNGGYSNWARGGGRGRSQGYRGTGYDRGSGYERGTGYDRDRGGGYDRGAGYDRDRGSGYERGTGYERDRGNGYERDRGSGYERGTGYERERGNGYERGRGGGGRGGRGYGRGRGRMGGRTTRGGGGQA